MPDDHPGHPSPEQLNAFARGEVSDTDLCAIERHLDSCQDCCRLLGGLRLTDPLLPRLQQALQQTIDENTDARGRAVRAMLQGSPEEPGRKLPSEPLRQAGAYRILGEVGRGGIGIVYNAHHLGLNRLAALKMVLLG